MDNVIRLLSTDVASHGLVRAVAVGRWWPDNWISPILKIEFQNLRNIGRITVGGYNPDFSPSFLDSKLTLSINEESISSALPWRRAFEVTLNLANPISGPCALVVAVDPYLASDKLDGRERGTVLKSIALHCKG